MGRVIDEGQTLRVRTGYVPRKQARDFHNRTERYACLVAHRRFGKTVAAINDLIRCCFTTGLDNVRVAYIAPYLSQSKAIAWDYLLEYTAAIPDIKVNIAELRIDFPNGSRIRLFGADNYNAMRGLYFDAVVLDEPADFPASAWPTVIRPALADRKGKATFIGTPKGKNDFWEIYNAAKNDPQWFTGMYKSSETGILDPDELQEAKIAMGEDRFEQEFECSFEAAIQGAYYATEMKAAADRITRVPYDPAIGVVTAWDLGIGDSTAIWFAQYAGQEIHIIDYYESSGVGLDHYAKVLSEKGYHYEQHILPHDVRVKELGSGKSRLETLDALGIRNIQIAPKLGVDDGIQAARSMIAKCWFDEERCDRGIEALRQYRREFDEKLKTWRGRPLHDWTSHGADAFRYLAVGRQDRNDWGPTIRRNLQGIA
jgi:phage terminase large subunit